MNFSADVLTAENEQSEVVATMYNDFARIYDKLQPDELYENFADYMEEIFKIQGRTESSEDPPVRFASTPPQRGIKNPAPTKPLILDLACGTGRLTTLLAKRGYDMIGIDISSDSLDIANDRAKREKLDILYLQQDMCDFELYGTVDAIVCCLDSVNYITDKRDLKRCFKLCENYLNPNGLLIFDINTPYKFEKTLADNTFVYDFDDIFCVWENNYDGKLNEFYITVFEKSGKKFEKFEETHLQRSYEIEEIKKLLADVGIPAKHCYHEFSFNKPKAKSERIFFICEKN